MRKIVLPLLAALTLSGCAGGFIPPSAPDMNKCCSMTAVISSDGESVTAELERSGINCWKITFADPSALCGMVIVSENGRLSAELDGISTEPDAESWAKGSVCAVITAIENAAHADGTETVTRLDGVIRMAGNGYTLSFDEESGALTAVECGTVNAVVSGYTATADAFEPQVILEE